MSDDPADEFGCLGLALSGSSFPSVEFPRTRTAEPRRPNPKCRTPRVLRGSRYARSRSFEGWVSCSHSGAADRAPPSMRPPSRRGDCILSPGYWAFNSAFKFRAVAPAPHVPGGLIPRLAAKRAGVFWRNLLGNLFGNLGQNLLGEFGRNATIAPRRTTPNHSITQYRASSTQQH